MKIIITQKDEIEDFSLKVREWSFQHMGSISPESLHLPSLSELIEFPLYRLNYSAEIETRELGSFSRPESTPVKSPPTLIDPASVDIWSFSSEPVQGFIHHREDKELPESLSGVQCHQCQGSGRRSCPECNGQKGAYCKECRGDGKIICPVCKHSQYVQCPRCKGHPKIYDDISKRFVECPHCHGRGEIKCDQCSGGCIVCVACRGKGRLPCQRCGEKGEIECTVCAGKGQNISGFALEIVHRPYNEILDLPNGEIPGPVLERMASQGDYVPVAQLGNTDLLNKSYVSCQVPQELYGPVEQMQRSMIISRNSRVVDSGLAVEKKRVFLMRFQVGTVDKDIWAVLQGGTLFIDPQFVKEVHASSLEAIRQMLESGAYSEALKLCGTLEKIDLLRPEIKKLRSTVFKRLFFFFAIGSLGGVTLFSAMIIPVLFHWRGTSLHFHILLAVVLAAALLIGIFVSVALSLLPTTIFGGQWKRVAGGFTVTGALLLVGFFAAASSKVDPAHSLDQSAMLQEYQRYFPFGLRTISRKEDVDFLRTLIAKYGPAGVDLSGPRKDLAWLERKQEGDDAGIARLKKISKNLEDMQRFGVNGNAKLSDAPRSKNYKKTMSDRIKIIMH